MSLPELPVTLDKAASARNAVVAGQADDGAGTGVAGLVQDVISGGAGGPVSHVLPPWSTSATRATCYPLGFFS